jgi:hypothetical protein
MSIKNCGLFRQPSGCRNRLFICIFALLFCTAAVSAAPLFSPTWGFRIDLPEGYQYSAGDNKDYFSFESPDGAHFDLIASSGKFDSAENLAKDTVKRLESKGAISIFEYVNKKACLVELEFSEKDNRGQKVMMTGWGLAMELDPSAPAASGKTALLLALAYGPAAKKELAFFHLSALDSIAASDAERLASGPVSVFSYPRGELKKTYLAKLGISALVAEYDAEGAQAFVDREFKVLAAYLNSPLWKEAWIRFYRAIYRDSWERLSDAAFQLERYWNVSQPPAIAPKAPASAVDPRKAPAAAPGAAAEDPNRILAGKALDWVQSFDYERDLLGSDFVNLVSAAIDGRGDCDSRALLWALVLAQANIPGGIMVSREYSHAMGLVDVGGSGAHFETDGKKWLVGETTAHVGIGLIGEKMSEISNWVGIICSF